MEPAAETAGRGAPTRAMGLAMQAVIVSVGLVAVLIAIAVTWEVFVRSVLGRPVIWVEEVTAYGVGYITFVGMGAGLWQGAHVGIEFLTETLRGPTRWAAHLLSDLLMLLLCLLLSWMSWGYWRDAWTSGERSTSLLSVPLWIPYSCFFGGCLLLLLVQGALTLRTLSTRQEVTGQ